MMAELPNSSAAKPNLARWMIPLALIACIIAAAAYEWYRGGLSSLGEGPRSSAPATEVRPTAKAVTALPNPLASEGRPALNTPAPVPEEKPPTVANASTSAPVPEATSASSAPSTPDAPAGPVAEVVLKYAGPSWTEIRDRSGQLLVSRLVAANSVEPVRGTPPLEVTLGNAKVVTLTYRGQAIDLAPYTRKNIARLTLQ
jgi:cytoskeleton protein RodZ